MSPAAIRTMKIETEYTPEQVHALADQAHNFKDIGASIASGSFRNEGMIVAPCSVKTLSSIATCQAGDLLSRAADVALKERRRLVLLFRETPLHAGHIALMDQATRSGAIVMPAVMGTYYHPKSVMDIIDHLAGRALDLLGIESGTVKRCREEITGMKDTPMTPYRDLHNHIARLEEKGLLVRAAREIDKDSELHPLVRWQFTGGLKEEDRKAFLFTNIRNKAGRTYEIPVIVGGLAANRAIYATGMGCDVDGIRDKWADAIANPVPPREVTDAPCHEIVEEGEILKHEGHGLDLLPIPVSTPGFDSAPTLSATNVITADPEDGVQNMGTYRCGLKAPDRLVVRMATRVGGAGGYQHYLKHQARGDTEMPVAIVLGCPPYVAFMGPQKLPIGMDEFTVAGGLAGAPT